MSDNEKEENPSKGEDRPSDWGQGNDRLRVERDLEDDGT